MCEPPQKSKVRPLGSRFHPNGVVGKSRAVSPSIVTMSSALEVPAIRQLPGGNDAWNSLGLLYHFRRETMRQMMLADDNFHVDPEIIRRAQDFHYAADSACAVFGIFKKFWTLTIMPSSFSGSVTVSGLGPMRSTCSEGAGMARSGGISIQSFRRSS